MTAIRKIDLHNLRNFEHLSFLGHFSTFLNEADLSRFKLELFKENLSNAMKHEDQVSGNVRKSIFSDEISALDKQRRKLHRGIELQLKSYKIHYNPSVRDAANRLWLVMEHFQIRKGKSSIGITANLKFTVEDFTSPNYLPDLELLNLVEWTTKLGEANAAYTQALDNRDDEQIKKPEGNAVEARKNTDKAYLSLVKRINALLEIEENEQLAKFAGVANTIIADYKKTMAVRRGRKKKFKERNKAEGD